MDIQIGRGKTARRAYGIDEIALAPRQRTLDPKLADTRWTIGGIEREIPIIASAMDSVVDVKMAVLLSELGALGVLNLEGVQTRYENPDPILDEIAAVGKDEFVTLMQRLYLEPIKPELIERRSQRNQATRRNCGGERHSRRRPFSLVKSWLKPEPICFFVQATVVSTAHLAPRIDHPVGLSSILSRNADPSDFRKLRHLRSHLESDESRCGWGAGRHRSWCGVYVSWSFGCGCAPGNGDR